MNEQIRAAEAQRRLQNMSTREIMQIRDAAFHGSGTAACGINFYMDEIKGELAYREHIPNRREGKDIRRERANFKKEGRGRRRR